MLEQGLKFTVCVISAHLLKYSIFSGLFFVLDSGWGVCPNLDAWVSAAVSECDISGGRDSQPTDQGEAFVPKFGDNISLKECVTS